MMQALVTSFPRLLFGLAGLPCGSYSIDADLVELASLLPLLYLLLDLASCLPGGWRSREEKGLSAETDEFLPTGWWVFMWSILGFEHASAFVVVSLLPGSGYRACLFLAMSKFLLEVPDNAFRGACVIDLRALSCRHL